MFNSVVDIASFSRIIGFAIFSAFLAFLLAPAVSFFLYKYKLRKKPKAELAAFEEKNSKAGTPTLGGLLVIIVVALVTIIFNWSRSYTWVPIGVMLLSSSLGLIDDILNIIGKKRKIRSFSHILRLVKVHKSKMARIYFALCLPWASVRSMLSHIGSDQSKGVQVHEKIFLQLLAGVIAAWWIYYKLGEAWHFIYIPFIGDIFVGWFIMPIIIFVVMFTANAVNIADGMDGLAGGALTITMGALAILSWVSGFEELAILNATALGALIAYTYFNIKPARFEMGDVGSLGLGALLAINALAIGVLSSLFFLAFVFYAEAISVILQTIAKRIFGKRIFGMSPIHYHFILKGWSEEKTIMRFWFIHLFFVIVGIWFALQ
jgi:phospho-N-acetylmuramoyl-pentapeptide-transferase